MGGTLLAFSRIRRHVRLSAQRLRAAASRQGAGFLCSTGSFSCTRRACWPAATSVLRTTRPISIRRSGPTLSRTMPSAIGIGIVTIVLLYRRTSQVASLGAILALAAALTIALVALAGLSHANFTQAFHLTQPVRFNLGFLAGFGSRALHHALRLRGLRRQRAARRRGRPAAAHDSYGHRALGAHRGDPLHAASDRRARRRAVAIAARCARSADRAGAIRRGVRRRTDLGTPRGRGRHAARPRYRLCVAVRKSARVFAHLLCGRARRRLSSQLREAASTQRHSLTSRCWPSAGCRSLRVFYAWIK